ncbi:MAG: protein tyrosine phosphatase [Myxococcaceae bacterium]|nr:protein tyrosine phosphatase [Myxococcaceae bacterium]
MFASLFAASIALTAASSPPPDVYAHKGEAFRYEAHKDLNALRVYLRGMSRLMQQVNENQALFTTATAAPLSVEQKRTVLSTWGALYGYFMSTEQIRQRYWKFVKLTPLDERHAWGYLLTHTALTAELAHGLAFAALSAGNSQLEVLFDEPNAEYGVPKGAFAAMKAKAVHAGTTTQLMTGAAWRPQALLALQKQKASLDLDVQWAVQELLRNGEAAKEKLLQKGAKLYLRNAVDILRDNALTAVFPVQKNIAEWMGDTRVARVGKPLISKEQVTQLLEKLRPGDIIVTRQNWFISNVGLPGFWPHAELYVGTAAELRSAFDADADVSSWVASQPEKVGAFSALLAARFPSKWKQYESGTDFQGHAPIRVIEAISEGVSLTAVEHAFGVDYLAAMRPKLPLLEKAKAITRAFAYQGRPYDFDFDFFSDASLVCTELVYKSYAPSNDMKGLRIDLVEVAGRRTLPANEWVKLFDAQLGTDQEQLEFVAFLDGQESVSRAVNADAQTLRASFRRPKWDVVQK